MFTSTSGTGSFIPIQVTEEKTTRSIIVRGKEKDLDVVDKVIREIDVRTKQVLMEVFIVEATSTFEQELGNKLGAAYSRRELELVVLKAVVQLEPHRVETQEYLKIQQTLVLEKIRY